MILLSAWRYSLRVVSPRRKLSSARCSFSRSSIISLPIVMFLPCWPAKLPRSDYSQNVVADDRRLRVVVRAAARIVRRHTDGVGACKADFVAHRTSSERDCSRGTGSVDIGLGPIAIGEREVAGALNGNTL